MQKARITVVGSNMIDLITYIDRMPRQGETIVAPQFDLGFGGKGANQAVAAALLGAEVTMVTRVGDDLFGPNTKKNFEKFGIDTTFVGSVPGVGSGVAPIFVDRDSNNSILIIKGANAHLKPRDIDGAKEKILESDMVIMQLEIDLNTVYYTAALCREHDIPVLLNPAPADPSLDIEKIKGVSFFAPNETELETLSGMPVDTLEKVISSGKSLLNKGLETIIVTLGERGSLLLSGDREELVPPWQVESKDSTGAGDAFIGCFAGYYTRTQNVLRAMEYANKYAALSTTKPGTQKSFLTLEEFEGKA